MYIDCDLLATPSTVINIDDNLFGEKYESEVKCDEQNKNKTQKIFSFYSE